MSDIFLAKLGAALYNLFPAIIGLLISMLSSKEENSKLMIGITLVLGIGVAHYLGHATIQIFDVQQESPVASGIIFLYGLFGLAIIREIFNQIPSVIRATIKRFIGE